MSEKTSLIMDIEFSRAFISAAIESGKAKIIDDTPLSKLNVKGGLSKFLVDFRATNRLKPLALEMALFFDIVDLSGLPHAIDIEQLEREQIVRLGFSAGGIRGWTTVPPTFVEDCKTWMIHATLRRTNSLLRALEIPSVRYRVMSLAIDYIELACQYGFDLKELQQSHIGSNENPDLDVQNSEYMDFLAEMYDALLNAGTDELSALFCMKSAFEEILYIWTLILHSQAFGVPFLSNKIRRPEGPGSKVNLRMHDTFTLCRVAMNEELGYAPVVNNLDDVLRLRNNKSIVRFRKLLFEWCQQLPSGDEQVLNRIKADLQKANKELRKLDKWKTVDRWLFWVQLPTALIPVVSTVVTMASFTTRAWIERREPTNSWICIGR